MGKASLILGVITLLLSILPIGSFIALFTGISGIIVAIMAYKKYNEQTKTLIAGLISSGFGLALAIIISLVFGVSLLTTKLIQHNQYHPGKEIVVSPPVPLNTFKLPAFSTATIDDEPHAIKMTVSLGYEINNSQLAKGLVNRKNQIIHVINLTLQGKQYTDLNNVSGQLSLAEEIKNHVNKILVEGTIKEVYFHEFVVK